MKLLLKIFICVILAGAQAALADDLYRCGNTYQDTPCKGVASKPINEAKPKKPNVTIHQPKPNQATSAEKTVATNAPSTALQTDCKKRGEDAKVIAKLRDIGVLENDQLVIATDVEKKALIKKVYGHSGNAFQIQNALEKECLQQQQKASLTSKWMSQARRMLGFGAAPAETSVKDNAKPVRTTKAAPAKPTKPQVRSTADPKPVIEPDQSISAPEIQHEPIAQPEPAPAPAIQTEPVVAQPEPTPAPHVPEPTPAPTAKAAPAPQPAELAPQKEVEHKETAQADPQGMCGALQAGLANIASQKRKGGDAAFMKDLKAQQTELENVMKSAGC
jgi:hypothetical protein